MVSNAVLYDPLLVHYLARELHRQLQGRACAAAPLFAAERRAVWPLDRNQALLLDLHPTRGWIRLISRPSDAEELEAVCTGVEAPADERLLRLRVRTEGQFRVLERELVVELHSNQWNALLVSADDGRIVSSLWSRTAGGRVLRPGQEYHAPPAPARFGAGPVREDEAWRRWEEVFAPLAPAERRAQALREFAYLGSPNVDPTLGEAAERQDKGALEAAFRRWWALRSLPPPEPRLLHLGERRLPYPLPLDGTPGEPLASLLEGMERVAALAPVAETPGGAGTEWRALLDRRVAAASRRVERLERELADTERAEQLRGWGDLLLARMYAVPRGASSVLLSDWQGKPVRIPLDPTLSPAENATRLYEEAKRLTRVDERLPALLEAARDELARWNGVARAAEQGEPPEWAVRELEAEASRRAPVEGGAEAVSRPYRVYRTSGGLEVRVGRSSKDNDRLTFGNSSPNDVWLHARSVPGSHVILRWSDPEGAPPARDLAEAAGLAALFSKARTSHLVPVDWTRRKYVRKPRGAPPGAVIPQRVRTLFVEPEPALEERLREG